MWYKCYMRREREEIRLGKLHLSFFLIVLLISSMGVASAQQNMFDAGDVGHIDPINLNNYNPAEITSACTNWESSINSLKIEPSSCFDMNGLESLIIKTNQTYEDFLILTDIDTTITVMETIRDTRDTIVNTLNGIDDLLEEISLDIDGRLKPLMDQHIKIEDYEELEIVWGVLEKKKEELGSLKEVAVEHLTALNEKYDIVVKAFQLFQEGEGDALNSMTIQEYITSVNLATRMLGERSADEVISEIDTNLTVVYPNLSVSNKDLFLYRLGVIANAAKAAGEYALSEDIEGRVLLARENLEVGSYQETFLGTCLDCTTWDIFKKLRDLKGKSRFLNTETLPRILETLNTTLSDFRKMEDLTSLDNSIHALENSWLLNDINHELLNNLRGLRDLAEARIEASYNLTASAEIAKAMYERAYKVVDADVDDLYTKIEDYNSTIDQSMPTIETEERLAEYESQVIDLRVIVKLLPKEQRRDLIDRIAQAETLLGDIRSTVGPIQDEVTSYGWVEGGMSGSPSGPSNSWTNVYDSNGFLTGNPTAPPVAPEPPAPSTASDNNNTTTPETPADATIGILSNKEPSAPIDTDLPWTSEETDAFTGGVIANSTALESMGYDVTELLNNEATTAAGAFLSLFTPSEAVPSSLESYDYSGIGIDTENRQLGLAILGVLSSSEGFADNPHLSSAVEKATATIFNAYVSEYQDTLPGMISTVLAITTLSLDLTGGSIDMERLSTEKGISLDLIRQIARIAEENPAETREALEITAESISSPAGYMMINKGKGFITFTDKGSIESFRIEDFKKLSIEEIQSYTNLSERSIKRIQERLSTPQDPCTMVTVEINGKKEILFLPADTIVYINSTNPAEVAKEVIKRVLIKRPDASSAVVNRIFLFMVVAGLICVGFGVTLAIYVTKAQLKRSEYFSPGLRAEKSFQHNYAASWKTR